jgi:hypothetical protein
MMHESVNGLRHSANQTAHRLSDAVPGDVAYHSAAQDSIKWRSHWFAIHTKTRRESFAATNVCALSLDVFLPELKTDYFPRGVAILMETLWQARVLIEKRCVKAKAA